MMGWWWDGIGIVGVVFVIVYVCFDIVKLEIMLVLGSI